MIRFNQRAGVSLIELIAAVIIASAATLIAVTSWPSRADSGGNHACTAMRAALQPAVDQYVLDQERAPNRIDRLADTVYWDGEVPTCPSSQRDFQIQQDTVVCPIHGSTPTR